MTLKYVVNDDSVTPDEFVSLFTAVWNIPINYELVAEALQRTNNITARDNGRLVGSTRILTDGYLFSVVTEVLIHPDYVTLHIDRKLLELAEQNSPSSICFGAQSLSKEVMAEMRWLAGPVMFFKQKPLRSG